MVFPLATILLACAQAAPAETDPSSTTDPPAAITESEDAPTRGIPHVPSLRADDPTRPPLLPEGIYVTQVRGSVEFEDSTGIWAFRSEITSESDFKRTFGLVPSMALDDMTRGFDTDDVISNYELTGRVLIYDGRNFLLLSVATPMRELKMSDASVNESDDAPKPSDAPTNSLDQSNDAADRLEARLRDRIQNLPESADRAPTDTGVPAATLREGTRLQNRRGAIVRDQNTGTWRFVFDAQGTDTVDPTMELLPCLLLERLERQAAVSDIPPSVLISGEVTSYRGRNYLLPTLWRQAGSSRNLTP